MLALTLRLPKRIVALQFDFGGIAALMPRVLRSSRGTDRKAL
jgi:hypothetical protein